MPLEMPKGFPFSVDTWSRKSDLKRHHFLTHAHKDHLASFPSHASYPIYCSHITKSLVLHLFPQIEEAVFVEIEIGKAVVVRDPEADFTVTAFDANHCPGAVMFLFEGEFGNVLHTGDCRLSDDCLQNFPLKYIAKKKKESVSQLDYLFLDCTFGRCALKIPTKQSAVQQVINCIWKHPNAPRVYLASDILGQEDILVEVCKTFGSKLYVDKHSLSECFQALQLIASEILSEDKSSRFQVIEGFPRLYERASIKLAEACTNMQPEPLFIRPSAQWYACEESQRSQPLDKPNLGEAIRDEFGIWHVCYSMHSSREELESSLRVLRPKWVISTTLPCRAMELDYVRKHCYKTQMTPDDPLWKLLKLGTGKSISSAIPNVSKVTVKTDTSIREQSTSVEGSPELQLETAVVSWEVQLDSPPEEVPITLFGRARMALPESYYVFDDTKTLEPIISTEMHCVVPKSKMVETIISGEAQSVVSSSKTLDIINSSKSHWVNPEFKTLETAIPSEVAEVSCLQEVSLSIKPPEDATISDTTSAPSVQGDNCKDFIPDKCKEESVFDKDDHSTRVYSTKLRGLYRSMHVPVPHPLPSLVELMSSSKRARVGSWIA